MEGGLDFIRLAPREQVYVYFSFSKGATRWRIRPGYFDPNRMIREEEEEEGEGRRMTRRETSVQAASSEMCQLALRFNFWRQLKSDADRGKSVINEPATFAFSALPSPSSSPPSSSSTILLPPSSLIVHRRILPTVPLLPTNHLLND